MKASQGATGMQGSGAPSHRNRRERTREMQECGRGGYGKTGLGQVRANQKWSISEKPQT
jgi:hypothetical protein